MHRLSIALALIALISVSLQAGEPTAASLAFTSQAPIVVQARQLMDQGKFVEAEQLLRDQLSPAAPQPTTASETVAASQELLEIMRRVRYEYSLKPEGLLLKLQKIIPKADAKDLERWATESRARSRVIDGQQFYFRREPQNIFIFSKAAQQARARSGNFRPEKNWPLTQHLAAVVQAASTSNAPEVLPVKHRVTHTLTIRPGNPLIKPGATVRVWLPLAQEYRQQRDVKLLSASPEPKVVAPSAIEGNPVTGAPQRTVYFEQAVQDPTAPLVFSEVFEYTSYAYYPQLDERQVADLPSDWNGAYLNERLPHIAFDPAIVAQVQQIVGSDTNALVKAKKIFRWVSLSIPWNAEDEYCTLPSFALRGFQARRGDCGVQNSLFITMCRIAGVPARWQSGFETKPGENWGMHDWAEIYIAPWGWLPADASYGIQASPDPLIADFYCGHQDSYRLIVNLDWGRELVPSKKSLRSEPADFQRGEVEVDGVNLYYDAWETKTSIDR